MDYEQRRLKPLSLLIIVGVLALLQVELNHSEKKEGKIDLLLDFFYIKQKAAISLWRQCYIAREADICTKNQIE